MKSKTPVVRDISWLHTIPQFVVLGVLVLLSAIFLWSQYGFVSISIGAFIYVLYSYGSRWFLLKHHRQGRKLTDQKMFDEAIKELEKSYEFFSNNLWLDQYRYLTMMTPTRQSYREMALINIAYCYGQIGDKERTKAYYERALQEFPNSYIANTALNFIATMEQDS